VQGTTGAHRDHKNSRLRALPGQTGAQAGSLVPDHEYLSMSLKENIETYNVGDYKQWTS